MNDSLLTSVSGPLELRSISVSVAVDLPAPLRRTFIAFTTEIDRWWNYRIRDGARSVIEPQAGGRWLQAWANGELLFGSFSLWDPPHRVRLAGPLAMEGFAHNVVDIHFDELDESTTRVRIEHRGIGDFDDSTAELYQSGWYDLLDDPFRAHLARG